MSVTSVLIACVMSLGADTTVAISIGGSPDAISSGDAPEAISIGGAPEAISIGGAPDAISIGGAPAVCDAPDSAECGGCLATSRGSSAGAGHP